MTKRRQFLQLMGMAGAAMQLPAPVFAQGANTQLNTVSLGGNLSLISGAGSNVLVAVGSDSVVVVDGGNQASAPALLQEINRISGNKPIAALFNTNWRPERTGLNYLLGGTATKIIAHENTRLWQSTDFYSEWQDTEYLPLPKAAQANETFYKTGTMELDDQVIEYGWISQANTDGDIYVRFPEENVLFVGDMLGVDSYPLMDYVTAGWIGGFQKTNAGLIALADDATKVIPSRGSAQGKVQLEAQQVMLDHAYNKVAEAFKTGRSVTQFLESDPMAEFNARLGDPTLFVMLLYKGTWYHVPGRAVSGII